MMIRLLNAIAEGWHDWTINRKAAREQRRLDRRKQHWRAAAVGGGGTVQLGWVTEAQAIKKIQHIKGENEPIVYVDVDQAFIAYGRMPEMGR